MLFSDTNLVRADNGFARVDGDTMTAIVTTLTGVCSGGGHLTFSVTGDASLTQTLDLTNLTDPISDQEKEAFLKVICKMAKAGRTVNQAKTLLQAGVTVTV